MRQSRNTRSRDGVEDTGDCGATLCAPQKPVMPYSNANRTTPVRIRYDVIVVLCIVQNELLRQTITAVRQFTHSEHFFGRLHVNIGFVGTQTKERDFRLKLDAEVDVAEIQEVKRTMRGKHSRLIFTILLSTISANDLRSQIRT